MNLDLCNSQSGTDKMLQLKSKKFLPSYPGKHRELCKQFKWWYCAHQNCYNIDWEPELSSQRKWGLPTLVGAGTFGHCFVQEFQTWNARCPKRKKLYLIFNRWFYFFFNLFLSRKAGLYQKPWGRPKGRDGSLFYGAWEQQGWEKCC